MRLLKICDVICVEKRVTYLFMELRKHQSAHMVSMHALSNHPQNAASCLCRRALPQLSDTEWKRYKPRHPTTVPASYPRTPHEVIENPALFRKVDPECLFFSFYFQPDTYQQVCVRTCVRARGCDVAMLRCWLKKTESDTGGGNRGIRVTVFVRGRWCHRACC